MGHFTSNKTERGGSRLLFLELVSWETDLVDLIFKGLFEKNLLDEFTVWPLKIKIAVFAVCILHFFFIIY